MGADHLETNIIITIDPTSAVNVVNELYFYPATGGDNGRILSTNGLLLIHCKLGRERVHER